MIVQHFGKRLYSGNEIELVEAILELDRARNSTEIGRRVIGGGLRENGRTGQPLEGTEGCFSTRFNPWSLKKARLWEAKSNSPDAGL